MSDVVVCNPKKYLSEWFDAFPLEFIPSKKGHQPLADTPSLLKDLGLVESPLPIMLEEERQEYLEKVKEYEGRGGRGVLWREAWMDMWRRVKRAQVWANHITSFDIEDKSYAERVLLSERKEDRDGFLAVPDPDPNIPYYSSIPFIPFLSQGEQSEEEENLDEDKHDADYIPKKEQEQEKEKEKEKVETEEYLTEKEVKELDEAMVANIVKVLDDQTSAIKYVHQFLQATRLNHPIITSYHLPSSTP